jgi:D-xylose transport system permease protein
MSATTTTPKESTASQAAKQLRANIQTYALVVALILIWLLFFILTGGSYLGPQNFSNLFRQMTVNAILSVGMVLVIVTGNIDLSVGRLAGFVSVVAAVLQAYTWPDFLAAHGTQVTAFLSGIGITGDTSTTVTNVVTTSLSVLIALGVGTLYGVAQGYIVAYLRVTAFIVTLGSMWILNGLILLETGGRTIPANQPMFSVIGQGYIQDRIISWIIAGIVIVILFVSMISGRRRRAKYAFALPPISLDVAKTAFFSLLVAGFVFYDNLYRGIQVPVLILMVIAVIIAYMCDNTKFGRHAYAIGGNREAARLSGINIQSNIFLIMVLMGFLCGVSGVILASYVGYGTIAAGSGYELYAIAGCILGGTSTLGGVGTIFGAMVGALIIASLTNGLQILNVPSAWQSVITGLVLVFAVYMDVYFKKNR